MKMDMPERGILKKIGDKVKESALTTRIADAAATNEADAESYREEAHIARQFARMDILLARPEDASAKRSDAQTAGEKANELSRRSEALKQLLADPDRLKRIIRLALNMIEAQKNAS